MTIHGLSATDIHPLPEHLAALLGPDLGGRAACAGLAPMFDAEVHGETNEQREARHHQAIDICGTCNVRAACTAARAELGREANGIWSGHSSTGSHTAYRARRTA